MDAEVGVVAQGGNLDPAVTAQRKDRLTWIAVGLAAVEQDPNAPCHGRPPHSTEIASTGHTERHWPQRTHASSLIA